MTAHKAFYMAAFVILGLFGSARGANPNKDDGESFEEEDLGFHVGLRGKRPWDWGSRIGARVGTGQGPNDDDVDLGFDLGSVGPIGFKEKPSTGGGASVGIGLGTGAIGPGFGIGPYRGDDGCGGCLFNPPLYNQPMYCRPVNCPNGGDCGGFGLHLDFGWPSLVETDRPEPGTQ